MSNKRIHTIDFMINPDKAEQIGFIIHDQFYEKKGFFEGYKMPEYILPSNLEEGSKEHALYLTYVISIDYMVNAVKLWERSREEYLTNPENFDPETILTKGDQTLRTIVKRVGARFPSTGAKT